MKSENENKRIKCERSENFDVTNNIISGLQEGSQLHQRLITSDVRKSWQNQLEGKEQLSMDDSSVGGVGDGGGGGIRCDDIDYGGDDDDDGGDLVKFKQGTRSTSSQQSNSVLMNLLVSGCDVSAGYVCLTKPKPSKGITSK